MGKRTDYSGAVALVTGGASGIGKALTEALADRGAVIAIADRQLAEGELVAEAIRRKGGTAYALELDVRNAEAFASVVDEVVRRSQRVDYFFNNAGIGVAGDVEQYAQRDWDDVLAVNLHGVTHGLQAVYPKMLAQGSGHIINTASIAGLMPTPGGASYAASKHAVVGLTKALRVEAARRGVRVSVLCPGVIRTPILTGGKFGRTELAGLDTATMLSWWERVRPMDPRAFAEQVLDAVSRNDAYIIVPKWWRVFWLLERISPTLSLLAASKMNEERLALMARAHVDHTAEGSSTIRENAAPTP